MENNKKYLDKFLFVFLIAFGATLFQTFASGIFGERSSKVSSFIFELFFESVFFVSLGIALSKWRQAAISILTTAALLSLRYFVFTTQNEIQHAIGNSYGDADKDALRLEVIEQVLYMIPFIVFFIDGKTSFKKVLQIVACIIVFRGITTAYYSQQVFDKLASFFSTSEETLRKYAGLFFFTSMHIFKVIFYCELQNFADGKAANWQTKLLNPGNNYDKLSAVLVFYVVKFTLTALVIGQYFQMGAIGSFSRGIGGSIYKFYYYNSLINTVFIVPVVLFCAWYLRKLILECFITYGISSKFVYWLLLLPGIGFIVWLVLIQNKKTQAFGEKVAAINNFSAAGSQVVTAVIVSCMILRCFLVLVDSPDGVSLIATVISFLLFIWLAKHRSGYYFNLYMSLAILLLLFIIDITVKDKAYVFLLNILFCLLLFNLAQLVTIYPVYYFEDFSYIDEDEKETGNEEDMLAEFES